MKPLIFVTLGVAFLTTPVLGESAAMSLKSATRAGQENLQMTKSQVIEAYGKLPMVFEVNQGQTDDSVRFLSRGRGYTLFLTATEAVLALRSRAASQTSNAVGAVALLAKPEDAQTTAPTVLRLRLLGANPRPRMAGLEEQPGRSNYFLGNDPKQWRTHVPTYAKVKYHAIYPGVDLVFYGDPQQLEYDYVLAPGADPGVIKLSVEGAEKVKLDAGGHVLISTGRGDLRLQALRIYQEWKGEKRAVQGGYTLTGDGQIGFQIGPYDRRRALVIDPVLSYSIFIGVNESMLPFGIAVDNSGNAYVSGITCATDLPTTFGAFQSTRHGRSSACEDAFVMKLNPTGSSLIYSTYLGGRNRDGGTRIAVDSTGAAYLTGLTLSSDFPTTKDAFSRTFHGGSCQFGPETTTCADAFVAKLNPDGSDLVYSTYLGGDRFDVGVGIAVDSEGFAYVAGATNSANFPTTPDPIQDQYGGGQCVPGAYPCFDAFVTKLSPDGSSLVYSTYLGGDQDDYAMGIFVDSDGNAYVAGGAASRSFPTTKDAFQRKHASDGGQADAFVAKLDSDGSALVYSTFLGGSGADFATAVVTDATGCAYVTGSTSSADFPTTPGSFQRAYAGPPRRRCEPLQLCGDGFVTKLNPKGSALVFSTYLGGSDDEGSVGIALDSSNNVWITGQSLSSNFPTTPDAYATGSGPFVSNLSADGSRLLFSTSLRSFGQLDSLGSIALDAADRVYAVGEASNSLQTTPGAYPFNPDEPMSFRGGFVVKFVSGAQPAVQVSPSLLEFSQQPLRSTSPPQTVTLSNTGHGPLDLAISLTTSRFTDRSSREDFAETDNCGSSLAPGSSCTINVTYQPVSVDREQQSVALTITHNAPRGPHEVRLSGSRSGDGPFVFVSPDSLTFAGQGIGTMSEAQFVQVEKTSLMMFRVARVTLTGPHSSDFMISSNTCGPLDVRCSFYVSFQPSGAGTRTATVVIEDSAIGSPHRVSLTGTGTTGPAVSLSSDRVDFGPRVVGTPSEGIGFSLQNTGASPLNVSAVDITGGDFAIEFNDCLRSIPVRGRCTVGMVFTPSTRGIRTGMVTIRDDAFDSPQTVSLTGTGINDPDPALVFNVSQTTDFGTVPVGLSTQPQFSVFTNRGNADLMISSITVSPNFSLSHSCPDTLRPSESCRVQIVFTPSVAGELSGSLTIVSNAPGSPHSSALMGTGIEFPATFLSTRALSFGHQAIGRSSVGLPVTLTNSGSGPLDIREIATEGDFDQTNTCGDTLEADASCTITVTFMPTAGGRATGRLRIVDNAQGGLHTVALSGIGHTGPAAWLVPSALNFGDQPVGSISKPQTVMLYNSGDAPLTVSGIIATEEFAQTNDCGPNLDPGESCAISVTFQPAAIGHRRGSFRVTDDGIGSPQQVTLTGTGTNPAPKTSSLSPSSASTGEPQVTLTVNGANFVNGSVVNFDGEPRATRFVSDTQLVVTLLKSDLATAGSYRMTVRNPAPGGGTSSPVNFLVID